MDLDRLLVIAGALLTWVAKLFLLGLVALESECRGAARVADQLLISTSADLNVVLRLLGIDIVVHDDAVLLLELHIPAGRRGHHRRSRWRRLWRVLLLPAEPVHLLQEMHVGRVAQAVSLSSLLLMVRLLRRSEADWQVLGEVARLLAFLQCIVES